MTFGSRWPPCVERVRETASLQIRTARTAHNNISSSSSSQVVVAAAVVVVVVVVSDSDREMVQMPSIL